MKYENSSQFDHVLECWLALGGVAHEMKEHTLRLTGKILATVAVAAFTFAGHASGDIASIVIGSIWVVTIPEFVEAWLLVRQRQKQQSEELYGDE